jgi:hypothetical protein
MLYPPQASEGEMKTADDQAQTTPTMITPSAPENDSRALRLDRSSLHNVPPVIRFATTHRDDGPAI